MPNQWKRQLNLCYLLVEILFLFLISSARPLLVEGEKGQDRVLLIRLKTVDLLFKEVRFNEAIVSCISSCPCIITVYMLLCHL